MRNSSVIPAFVMVLCVAAMVLATPPSGASDSGSGVEGLLRVHPDNGRYLTNDSGKAILLAGSHTWSSFQDYEGDASFPYGAWLDDLDRWGHNFFRGWMWEDGYYTPSPYVRVSGGRFDLDRFEPRLLERLSERLAEAEAHGKYVGVMLFQGWSVSPKNGLRSPDPWLEHPFRDGNEINGMGITDRNGESLHTLQNGRVTERQKAWVSYLVRGLNNFDNIVWEISNESHDGSMAWQDEMTAHIRELESGLLKQHMVWVSCAQFGGASEAANQELFDSRADIISPCRGAGDRYVDNPPATRGAKVLIADTDHLQPANASVAQVWRGFMRGMHPAFMDWYTPLSWWTGGRLEASRIPPIRTAVGTILRLSQLEDLASMVPQSESESFPANSRYALFSSDDVTAPSPAFNRRSLLAYLPAGEDQVVVCDLTLGGGYDHTWYDAIDGSVKATGHSTPDDRCLLLNAPTAGSEGMVLHLRTGDGSATAATGLRATSGGARNGTDEAAYDWTDREEPSGQHDSAESESTGDGG